MSDEEKDVMIEGVGIKQYSKKNIASYNMAYFGSSVGFSFLLSYGLYFYEVEIGLPILFFAIAYTIYGIWDAFNDPLVGFLSDKTYFFTKKWGRRFPWIIIGSIPVTILMFFVFAPPDIDPVENAVLITLWLIFFLCAYEWFATASLVNWRALFPQKFRTDKDRRTSVGMETIIWVLVQFFGIVVPPLFIIFGDKSSFLMAALIVVIVSIPFIILGIPGCREDQEMIERVLKNEEQAGKIKFIPALKIFFKNRNVIAMVIVWLTIDIFSNIAIGSTIYYVRYVIQGEEFYASILLLALLIAVGASIPFWLWLIRKIGEIKVLYITVLGMVIGAVPMIFVYDFTIAIISYCLVGASVGGLQCADEPLWGSAIDQMVLEERKHLEGAATGILNFTQRLILPITTIIFTISHIVTGFDPSADVQTPFAQLGIVLTFTLIPMIIVISGVFVWRKLWSLSEDDRVAVRAQLKELDL